MGYFLNLEKYLTSSKNTPDLQNLGGKKKHNTTEVVWELNCYNQTLLAYSRIVSMCSKLLHFPAQLLLSSFPRGRLKCLRFRNEGEQT